MAKETSETVNPPDTQSQVEPPVVTKAKPKLSLASLELRIASLEKHMVLLDTKNHMLVTVSERLKDGSISSKVITKHKLTGKVIDNAF